MILYVFNPEAKNAKRLKGKIKSYLAHLDLNGEFVEAKQKEDVANIAQEALDRDIDTIVAIGGDGIVNRIIQVIAGKDITLGVIPIGETNLLAKFLKINNWRKGCEVLVKKEIINLNLGLVNDKKYFISSVEVESEEEKTRNFFKKIVSRKKEKKYTNAIINIENINSNLKMQTEVSSIMISSMPFPLPENIDLQEIMEKEELSIITKSKPQGKNKTSEEITVLAGRKIDISSKQKMDVKIDGENFGKTNVSIEILPKALRVITPKRKEIQKI